MGWTPPHSTADQLHGVDRAERPVWCKRLSRNRWIEEIEQNVEPGVEIGMEACGGAHHRARLLQSKGYRVRLIAPQFVKPYVKSNKTDANYAQAVCEAMSRPSNCCPARSGSGVAGGCVQWTDGAIASAALRVVRGSAGAR